jgi:hypothetical protein
VDSAEQSIAIAECRAEPIAGSQTEPISLRSCKGVCRFQCSGLSPEGNDQETRKVAQSRQWPHKATSFAESQGERCERRFDAPRIAVRLNRAQEELTRGCRKPAPYQDEREHGSAGHAFDQAIDDAVPSIINMTHVHRNQRASGCLIHIWPLCLWIKPSSGFGLFRAHAL